MPSLYGYRDIFDPAHSHDMTHFDVAFKLQHDCPYNSFSKEHPSVVVSHWCNWSRDVLEISHRDVNGAQVQRGINELVRDLGSKVLRKSFAATNLQVVFQHCACDKLPPPTLPVIERRNCLELQPTLYTEGWEWYRIIAFSNKDLTRLFKDLDEHCKLEILSRTTISDESVRETFPVSTGELFGSLTNKQRKALMNALDSGYYSIPRNVSASDIAKRLHVPRTSFTDHLRKAENKVLRSVGPYLRLKSSDT